MTRFFMSLDNAVDLVYMALEKGEHNDLWVYKNKSCTIKELADLFSDDQEIVGNRCEEKTDEALLTVNELNHSILYEDKYYRVNKDIDGDTYTIPLQSDSAERLTRVELQEMLDKWREYNGI